MARFYPLLEKMEKDNNSISLEFSALGRQFRFRMEPVPLPLASQAAFLYRRFSVVQILQILKGLSREVFKGIVQRDLTGVETRLKKFVLLSYSVSKSFFLILKGHRHEKSIKPVSAS